MVNEFWVVGVLQDLSKYAEDNGLKRFNKAMESAADDFLDDMRDQHLKGIAHLDRKEAKPLYGQVVVPFPKMVKH